MIIILFLLISGYNYGYHFAFLSSSNLKTYWLDPKFFYVYFSIINVISGLYFNSLEELRYIWLYFTNT